MQRWDRWRACKFGCSPRSTVTVAPWASGSPAVSITGRSLRDFKRNRWLLISLTGPDPSIRSGLELLAITVMPLCSLKTFFGNAHQLSSTKPAAQSTCPSNLQRVLACRPNKEKKAIFKVFIFFDLVLSVKLFQSLKIEFLSSSIRRATSQRNFAKINAHKVPFVWFLLRMKESERRVSTRN